MVSKLLIVADVADTLVAYEEAADMEDNALRLLTVAEVPEIVTPRDDVALRSTTLVAAEKLTAPVTVPPDRGK